MTTLHLTCQIFGNCHFYIQKANKSWPSLPEIFMPLARVGLSVTPISPEILRQTIKLEFRFSSTHNIDIKAKSEIKVRKIEIVADKEESIL